LARHIVGITRNQGGDMPHPAQRTIRAEQQTWLMPRWVHQMLSGKRVFKPMFDVESCLDMLRR